MVEIGSYCLATKYGDGDPGDAWAVGYYIGELPTRPPGSTPRHLVGGADGKSYRANGYRRVRAGLRPDVGAWLLSVAKELETSPGGVVNLWEMLGDRAFETDEKEGRTE